MSAEYPFSGNGNFKGESVLDSTILVEEGVVWDQEEVQVSLRYANDPNDTLTGNNNESYLTANDGSNDTQYFSVLETSGETTLNDLSNITTICQEDDAEASEDQPAISSLCTIGGQPDIYRIEGSDELYAFEIACDQEGNIQRFRYRLRPNENGEYESVPESIELLPLENEPESDSSQISAEQVPEQHEEENEQHEEYVQPMLHSNVKIFVKEEYSHESILPDISSPLDESNSEDSGDELQVNEEETAATYDEEVGDGDADTKAGIIEHSLLPVSKVEAISHYKSEETTSAFDEALFEQTSHNINEGINHQVDSPIHNENFQVSVLPNQSPTGSEEEEEEEEEEDDTDTGAEHEPTRYELLIGDNHEPTDDHMFTKPTSQNTTEDSEEHFESRHNIEYLEDMNDNESDTDDFHIVDGIHVTADGTDDTDEAAHMIEAFMEREHPAHQILKLQQQIPVLQSVKTKKILNKSVNKANNKGLMYYVVKHPEKENVATIAHHMLPNKMLKTNPRSVLKSSYSYFEQKKEKEKPQVQKIEKKLLKNKEALQARVFHNFISKTTILHAPVRQQRLPRKQTIKPVERADEEIIVQEVVVSSNGFIETSEDGVIKSKVPLKPTEIVQLSDSDDDYDPKRENKKRRKKKRKSKVPEIVISDSDEEASDENIVQIDLSADSEPEEPDRTSKPPAEVEVDNTVKKRRGRPPKRRNSATDETSTTDGSSSSKKQRRNTKDSVESNESSESKSEERAEIQNIKTKWKCTKCPKIFPSQGSLKSHMQYHNFHEPKDRNLRPSTSTTFKKPESAVAPLKNKYECTVCRETFKNNFLLMKHKKEHVNKNLECSICKKIFADRAQLISHKRTHIKEQMFKSTTLPKHSPKSTSKSPKKTDKLKCSICSKVFTTLQLLTSHTKTHKRFPCTNCAASFISKLALEDHVRQNCVKQSTRRLSFKTRKSFLASPQRVSKRISLRKSVDKRDVSSSGSQSSGQGKKRFNSALKLSLRCDNCSMTFMTHKALFKHKVVKHGYETPDKNIHIKTRKSLHVGKHGSVPGSSKMRNVFSNLRTKFPEGDK